jgi:hypothetical protein
LGDGTAIFNSRVKIIFDAGAPVKFGLNRFSDFKQASGELRG